MIGYTGFSLHGFKGLGDMSCGPNLAPRLINDGSAQGMSSGVMKCCGIPGVTPPEEDPCSFLNTNQGYLATQAQANADALQTWSGTGSVTENIIKAAAGVPNNIAVDANTCFYAPGKTFTDDVGIVISCPSDSVTSTATAGQPESTMSQVQLINMLNNLYGAQSKNLGLPSNAIPSSMPAPVSLVPFTSSPKEGIVNSNPTGGGNTSNIAVTPEQNIINSPAPTVPTTQSGSSDLISNFLNSVGLTTTNSTAGSTPGTSTGSFLDSITPTEWVIGGIALVGLMFFMSKGR